MGQFIQFVHSSGNLSFPCVIDMLYDTQHGHRYCSGLGPQLTS